MKQNLTERSRGFLRENRAIVIVMLALLAERLIAMLVLSFQYTLNSDDWAYVLSGIEFAKTGTISIHGYLSAQIMPGMPVFLGLISMIFGQGRLYLLVLKLLWISMGTLTAFFIYRSVCLFAPKWCGVAAVLPLFAPEFVWLDQLTLTETPYILCSAAMIYFTLQMARSEKKRYFWLCALCYLLSLMLKANAGIYPLFAAFYLLLMRYDFKKLLRQGVILGCMMLLLLTPWTIRNERQFHAFIPLTCGSGNPMLLGTYQGVGYPEDETLDYVTNVDVPMGTRFREFYDDDWHIREERYYHYLSLQRDGIQAKYRMREWFRRDRSGFLRSYLLIKPWIMVSRVYYITGLFGIPITALHFLRRLCFIAVLLLFVLSFVLRRRRRVMLFLAVLYAGNLYLYATSFAFPRYGQSLVHIWFILLGIGLPLLADAGRRIVNIRKKRIE